MSNLDKKTVEGFGDEWSTFDQSLMSDAELRYHFSIYFKNFPWDSLPSDAEGFDLGCGSGRWAKLVSERVNRLHCIDASAAAVQVARKNLENTTNCYFHVASVDNIPLQDESMDFGYSLGVLHHVPDTAEGIRSCVAKLKEGAPFLIYLYYAFDNRPFWFVSIWKISNTIRQFISILPFFLRYWLTQIIALLIYFPAARFSLLLEKIGINVELIPLSSYRHASFYTMRTDALDRFGTSLEQRFTANEIKVMLEKAGLERIQFNDSDVYWIAIGYKRKYEMKKSGK